MKITPNSFGIRPLSMSSVNLVQKDSRVEQANRTLSNKTLPVGKCCNGCGDRGGCSCESPKSVFAVCCFGADSTDVAASAAAAFAAVCAASADVAALFVWESAAAAFAAVVAAAGDVAAVSVCTNAVPDSKLNSMPVCGLDLGCRLGQLQ